MTRDEVLALVARRKEAMDRRDMQSFNEIYAAAARLESPLAGSVVGVEAIATATEAFLAAFPDAKLVEETPIIDDLRVTVVTEITGSHLGTLLGLPPSGRAFHFSAVILLTCGDGRIVHERRIYDFTGLLVQIGVLKAKPAS